VTTGKNARRLRRAVLLAGVVGVSGVVVLTGYQALQARDALQQAAVELDEVSAGLADGDTSTAREAVVSAQAAATRAHEQTDGANWWLASRFPAVGDDVDAVRTVAGSVDRLSSEVLPAVVDAAGTLSPEELKPVNGRVDLAPIDEVAPDVVAAAEALGEEQAKVAGIDTSGLVADLQEPVRRLQEKLADAADLGDRASRAVRLLPPMLGADGKRTYVLMFQNNAEVRATGGIPGAFATVTAENGRISLEQQASAVDFGRFEKPALLLTPAEKRLFADKLGIYPQDTNLTPDFPRTAALVRAQWRRALGVSVDGVLSTDPVALAQVLQGTGPVRLPTGEGLTAENAVRLLLHEVYLSYPENERQDLFFEVAAERVFNALTRGQGDPRAALDGVAQAAGEGRLLVWSAHEDEQELLAGTTLSGALTVRESEAPHVGVFLNDATASKMDYFLHYRAGVAAIRCRGDRQTLRVTVRLRSTAPALAETRLPAAVTGPKSAAGTNSFRTNVYVYLPSGGRLETASLDGQEHASNLLKHRGRPVVVQTVELRPGQSRTLAFDLVAGEGQVGDPALRVTPGVHGAGVGEVSGSACS
jgi:hypothetical protein